MHGTKNEPTWFSTQSPSPQDGTLGLENPLKSLLEHKSIFCCSYLFVVINIFKLLRYVLSFEGLAKVDLQVLNTRWQTIGFLYGIIGVRFEVLVKQVTCIVLGRILLRTKVQFPPKL